MNHPPALSSSKASGLAGCGKQGAGKSLGWAAVLALFLAPVLPARVVNATDVNDFTSLVNAINAANSAAGNSTINFTSQITLTGALPQINPQAGSSIAFTSNSPAFGAAILFFLLLPVGVNDCIRIHRINTAQINEEILNQTRQINSLEDALNKTSSVQEVEDLMKFPPATDSKEEYTLESAKKKATEKIRKYQEKTQAEIEQRKQEQWLGLVRDSVRYIIGIILCAVFYISIWRVTKEIVVSLE